MVLTVALPFPFSRRGELELCQMAVLKGFRTLTGARMGHDVAPYRLLGVCRRYKGLETDAP